MKKLIKLSIISSIFLLGCDKKKDISEEKASETVPKVTHYDSGDIPDYPMFEEMTAGIKAQQYCKAEEVSEDELRYHIRDELELSKEEKYSILMDWQKLAKYANAGCKLEHWNKSLLGYQEEINKIQQEIDFLEKTQKQLIATMYLDKQFFNKKYGYEYVPATIDNQSPYNIQSITLNYTSIYPKGYFDSGNAKRQETETYTSNDMGKSYFEDESLEGIETPFKAHSTVTLNLNKVLGMPPTETVLSPANYVIPIDQVMIVDQFDHKELRFDKLDNMKRDIKQIEQVIQTGNYDAEQIRAEYPSLKPL